jgi:hypothetical protein
MGAAKEHRYMSMSRRLLDAETKDTVNTKLAKAQWWRDLMNEGHILTFRACCGSTITAGMYQVAVATDYNPGFALLGLPGGKEYHGDAWGIALRIVEYCGRVLPILIDGERTQ